MSSSKRASRSGVHDWAKRIRHCTEGRTHPYEQTEPSGYCQWFSWVEKYAETHDNTQCPDCGLWVIWTPKETAMAYDSRPDTYEHIGHVRGLLLKVAQELINRADVHDASKLEEPEVEVFDEYTPKLKDSTYGSDEYKQFLVGMGAGLQHHYEANDHHPEHHAEGVHGMHLLQVIEMLCDWKAATLRHADGDLGRSIIQNADRFEYGDEIKGLLMNTAEWFGWL